MNGTSHAGAELAQHAEALLESEQGDLLAKVLGQLAIPRVELAHAFAERANVARRSMNEMAERVEGRVVVVCGEQIGVGRLGVEREDARAERVDLVAEVLEVNAGDVAEARELFGQLEQLAVDLIQLLITPRRKKIVEHFHNTITTRLDEYIYLKNDMKQCQVLLVRPQLGEFDKRGELEADSVARIVALFCLFHSFATQTEFIKTKDREKQSKKREE